MLVPMCGLDGGKTSSGGGDAVRAVVAADSFDPKRKLRGDGGGSGGGLQVRMLIANGFTQSTKDKLASHT